MLKAESKPMLRIGVPLLGVAALLLLCGLQLLLLLVPAAGAFLVRQRCKETSLLHVLVSGAVVGTCLFWLGVWALLPVLGGPWAALWSIAAVVGIAAAVRRWDQSAEPPLILPSRKEAIGLGVLAGAVFLSILISATPLVEFSETMQFHVPLVASMERGNVPPINLQEPPDPLYYHYGQHALAAALASLGRLPTPMALFITNAWFGALAAAYAFVLGRKIAGLGAGFVASVLMVGAGTFNWISAPNFVSDRLSWAELMNPLGYPFSTGNIAIGSFAWRVHGNSMAWAMCLALLAVDMFNRAKQTRRFEFALAAGVAIGVLSPANETLFVSLLAATGTMPVLWWLRDRDIDWRLAVQTAVTLAVGLALVAFTGGVMKTFFLERSATHGANLVVAWKNVGTVASWNFGDYFPLRPDHRVSMFSLRFLQDVGPLPLLLIPALLWAFLRAQGVTIHLAVASLVALVLSSVATLTEYPENTYRLVNLCVVLAAIPVGTALAALPSALRGQSARRLAGIAVGSLVALCVASWPLLHVGIAASFHRNWYPEPDGGVRYNQDAIEFLRNNSEFDEAVLSIPYGSWAVLGSGQSAPTGSYVGDQGARFARDSSRAVQEVDLGLMRGLAVRYLYVNRERATAEQRGRIAELAEAGELRQVWESEDRASMIFQLADR